LFFIGRIADRQPAAGAQRTNGTECSDLSGTSEVQKRSGQSEDRILCNCGTGIVYYLVLNLAFAF
jgi:hypothetical protein